MTATISADLQPLYEKIHSYAFEANKSLRRANHNVIEIPTPNDIKRAFIKKNYQAITKITIALAHYCYHHMDAKKSFELLDLALETSKLCNKTFKYGCTIFCALKSCGDELKECKKTIKNLNKQSVEIIEDRFNRRFTTTSV